MSTRLIIYKFILFSFCIRQYEIKACQCPLSSLSIDECAKYEIIFKGKISSIKSCGEKFGEALFIVEELYKGNAEVNFKVLFDCQEECAYEFKVGEEWIIYSKYKQINNAKMDWCSRSRRHFSNEKEDYYLATYGNDYLDEVKFLRDKLGLHRLLIQKKEDHGKRNALPNLTQAIVSLLVSLGGILIFYFLFTKFFK